jgi:choline dehydrogenase-like flavoprotein
VVAFASNSWLAAWLAGHLTAISGAYSSPTILLRSGIGPKEDLAPFNIECIVDSPGVGKNFQDHLASLSLSLSFRCPEHTFQSSSSLRRIIF